MVIGRDVEIAHLRTLLDDARAGRTGVLVLRGDPGIGKTHLLEHCSAGAGDDVRVVRVHGHEAEQDIPFAALSMLLGPLADGTVDLPLAQSAALEAALSIGQGVHGDRMAVDGAVLAVLTGAAERQPLLLTIDDAHLVDLPTLEALIFAVRRMQRDAVAVLLTVRPAVDVDPVVQRWLEPFRTLDVAGLGLDAARELTGSGALTEAEWAATGGNPLALLEMTAAPGGVPVDEPLHLPGRLQRAYGNRLTGLDDGAREALLLAAVAGRAVEVLDDALAERGLTRSALEGAEEAGLVVLDAGTVAFTHPLVRSAVYHGASPAVQRCAHRTLAAAYAGRTAQRALERRAFHLAAATIGPDEAVAAELAGVAEQADERHSPTTAAVLFEKAARLSMPGLARTQRIVRAAVAGQAAGTLEAVGPLLELAMAETDDDDLRTMAAHLRCRIEMWSGRPAQARDQLLALADGTEVRRPEWSALMCAQAAIVSIALGEQRMAVGMAARAMEIGRSLPDAERLPVLVTRAVTHAVTGETDAARDLLRRCAPHLPGLDPLSIDQILVLVAVAYASVEDLAAARRWLTTAVTRARGVGATGLLPFQLSWLTLVCWLDGDWVTARAHGVSAVQVAEQTGWETELPNCLIALATVEAGYGNEDAARKHAARAAELGAVQSPTRIFAAHAARVRGLLALGTKDHDEAAAMFAEVGAYARSARMGDQVLFSWAGNLTESLIRAKRPEQARAAYAATLREAGRTGRPTARAVAARCGGLLATSLEEGRRHFDEACRWHAQAGQPFEHARTELCYGEFLRRHHRRTEARDYLGRARGTFARLGAGAWLQRTHDELLACGDTSGRPARALLPGLTAQEHQVAVMVAEGITNKEVAERLYMAPKTVESHLSSVYRKLGLRNRGELIRMLATGA